MGEYLTIEDRIVMLGETITEGIDHFELQIKNGEYRLALGMLIDVSEGVIAIETAFCEGMMVTTTDEWNHYMAQFRQAMEQLAEVYEKSSWDRLEASADNLRIAFNQLKERIPEELNRTRIH